MTHAVSLFWPAMFSVALGGSAWALARRRRAARRQAPAGPPGRAVPARAVFCHGAGLLGGACRNSIAPRLVISEAGLHFRALGARFWSHRDTAHAEVRRTRSGWKLSLVGRRRGKVLAIDFAVEDHLVAALRALPADTARTPHAAQLRDGTPATATPGLSPYRGRLR